MSTGKKPERRVGRNPERNRYQLEIDDTKVDPIAAKIARFAQRWNLKKLPSYRDQARGGSKIPYPFIEAILRGEYNE